MNHNINMGNTTNMSITWKYYHHKMHIGGYKDSNKWRCL